MPNILDDLSDRLDRLEFELSELRIVPTDPNEVWADGAVRVSDAPAFCGISRSELYNLMNRGELPWSKPSRDRLVPRRWLVRYLATRAEHATTEAI